MAVSRPSLGRLILVPALITLAVTLLRLIFAAFAVFPSPVVQLAVFTLLCWLAVAVARRGWPARWRVLLAYGLAARVPVVVVMFLAIFLGWDTHYAKPRPDFPPMGHWGLFFWTALLPQLSIWIYVTVVGGMLFGAIAVGIRRLVGGGADEGVPRAPVSAGA